MIWADRAGLAVAALVLLGCALLFAAGGITRPAPPAPRAVTAEEIRRDPLAELKAAYDANGGWSQKREAGGVVDAAVLAGRGLLYVALPIWIMLRLADFVFDGPGRRRRRRVQSGGR